MPRLTIHPATDDDLDAYLELRDATAEQLVAAGIVQWQPRELSRDGLLAWLGDGQLFAAWLDGELVGGLMVMWADPVFWGDRDDGSAGYTHGLLIDRRLKGDGLGGELLAFFERHIGDHGKSVARLDTVSTNTALRRYYRSAGYTEVGRRAFAPGEGPPIDEITLFEKQLKELR